MTWAVAEVLIFAAFLALAYALSALPTNKMQLAVRELTDARLHRQRVDSQLDAVSEAVLFVRPDAPQASAVIASLDSRRSLVTVAHGRDKSVFDLKRRGDVQTLLPILLLSK
ncbi:hypothetical protein SB87_gp036 [Parapoxvirus red deer/HL953]|uniref:Entry-fusion complex protein OPG086 n=1 Tax=Parapoxvirus red deer/HL953 TaxID=1579460 RepID=A0A0A7M9X7_9POXV|nr:hypothetical protein SB87_gp036 [Parapoxvirus red deer/HL953]AIZ77289.1 hypothetical protein [Parapoxvirus red deer/HL953]